MTGNPSRHGVQRKRALADEAAKAAAEAVAEKARKEREENPTTEDLLKLILTEMRSKK